MKLSSNAIILIAVSNYLTEEEWFNLKTEVVTKDIKQERKLLTTIEKYFDIEKFKDKPYIWQDIWIYNYIKYDSKSKPKHKRLLAKYEREIIIPSYRTLNKFIELLK